MSIFITVPKQDWLLNLNERSFSARLKNEDNFSSFHRTSSISLLPTNSFIVNHSSLPTLSHQAFVRMSSMHLLQGDHQSFLNTIAANKQHPDDYCCQFCSFTEEWSGFTRIFFDSPSRNPPPPSGDFMLTPPSDGDLALLLANAETMKVEQYTIWREKFKLSWVRFSTQLESTDGFEKGDKVRRPKMFVSLLFSHIHQWGHHVADSKTVRLFSFFRRHLNSWRTRSFQRSIRNLVTNDR